VVIITPHQLELTLELMGVIDGNEELIVAITNRMTRGDNGQTT